MTLEKRTRRRLRRLARSAGRLAGQMVAEFVDAFATELSGAGRRPIAGHERSAARERHADGRTARPVDDAGLPRTVDHS